MGRIKSDNINRWFLHSNIYYLLVNGTLEYDHIKRLITLTSDYIMRLLLYLHCVCITKSAECYCNNKRLLNEYLKWIEWHWTIVLWIYTKDVLGDQFLGKSNVFLRPEPFCFIWRNYTIHYTYCRGSQTFFDRGPNLKIIFHLGS